MSEPSDQAPLARYDLRLRSLDPEPGEPIWLCSTCDEPAHWSVWLHTPEWGPQGGDTRVLCTIDALSWLTGEASRSLTDPAAPKHANGSSQAGEPS
jgi:hypothetical protein